MDYSTQLISHYMIINHFSDFFHLKIMKKSCYNYRFDNQYSVRMGQIHYYYYFINYMDNCTNSLLKINV